jgi:hypothetical protein
MSSCTCSTRDTAFQTTYYHERSGGSDAANTHAPTSVLTVNRHVSKHPLLAQGLADQRRQLDFVLDDEHSHEASSIPAPYRRLNRPFEKLAAAP